MHRALARRKMISTALVGKMATFAGSLARTLPGVGGAVSVCFGLGLIYRPLFFIAIGALLLVLDRRMP